MMSLGQVKRQWTSREWKSDDRRHVRASSGTFSTGSIRAALKSAQTLSTRSGYVGIPRYSITTVLNDSQDLLTRHKNMVAQYLSANFDEFFSRYNNLLIQSGSYVTKRQSIKLLGEILLDRANYNVMTAYVDSGAHLKLCMNLLKDDRKMVQYEGFHVFKVFVANPNKSVAVQRILINNRDRLLKFLPKFLEDRTDDDQFTDEKSFLVRQIELLPSEPVDTRPQPVSGVGVGAMA
jgi:calcium binding protein 39